MAKKAKPEPQYKDELTRLFSQFAGNSKEGAVLVIQRPYLKLCRGDHLAALLLSQIMYWQERTTDPDGWFSHSYQEWESELGLSHYQVKRLISGERRERKGDTFKLEDVGVETKLKRSKHHKGAATIHYRCNWAVLSAALSAMIQLPVFDNVENPVFDNVENDDFSNVENVYIDYTKDYSKESFAPTDVDASQPAEKPTSKPKTPTPQQAMFDAICQAFKYDLARITKSEKGRIGKVAAELVGAGYAPLHVPIIHMHCSDAFDNFTVNALATSASDAMAAYKELTGIDPLREVLITDAPPETPTTETPLQNPPVADGVNYFDISDAWDNADKLIGGGG